ncbi:MAG: SDR family oxidoreductase [Planctomycetes bacterium]|nr:SDR family oxidoreductase [Planctomycetota bacterium]
MADWKNKRVLITGGSRGIGRACAELLASRGATVFVNYASNDQAAAETRDAIRAAGGRAELARADMGDGGAVESMWARATADGPIDSLVLNAAYQKKATVDQTDLELMERTFRINVMGNFRLARLFIGARRAAGGGGSIVIHSSNQGELVNPTAFAYALTKAALNHMVRHLAVACAKDRIRVNGIILGWFDTEGEREFYSPEMIAARVARTIPLGRAGESAEAARLTAFLAGDDASYMTGSLVRLDGGFALAPDVSV